MPDHLTLALDARPPCAPQLPLRGVTVLVVEDSRLACEALRLMCRKLGARLRRAESLQTARLHLRLYRPDVVVVDLGLPDGRGEGLIADLVGSARRPMVLGLSGDGAGRANALAAGADGYLDKPVDSIGGLQALLLALLEERGLPVLALDGDHGWALNPDPLALRDDLAYAAALIGPDPDPDLCRYVAGFVGGVARQAQDRPLAEAALRAQPKGLRDALCLRLAQPNPAFARPIGPLGGSGPATG